MKRLSIAFRLHREKRRKQRAAARKKRAAENRKFYDRLRFDQSPFWEWNW